MVVDLTSGDAPHWVRLEGVVKELYDVAFLPGCTSPMAIGFVSDPTIYNQSSEGVLPEHSLGTLQVLGPLKNIVLDSHFKHFSVGRMRAQVLSRCAS